MKIVAVFATVERNSRSGWKANMPSSSAARVPLTLVVWRPTGDDEEEERHVTSWDLIISELPLLLDPAKCKSPIWHLV